MDGLTLLAWIVGVWFLYGCFVFAVELHNAPLMPPEYGTLDETRWSPARWPVTGAHRPRHPHE